MVGRGACRNDDVARAQTHIIRATFFPAVI